MQSLNHNFMGTNVRVSPFLSGNHVRIQHFRKLPQNGQLCNAPLSQKSCVSASLICLERNRSSFVTRTQRFLSSRAERSGELREFRVFAIASPVGPSDEEEEFEGDFGKLSEAVEALAQNLEGSLQQTSIYLVGMMGSGKSTVGRMLAKALEYQFFDTDNLIELAARRSVSDIFSESGEETFRDAETDTLKALAPITAAVVATGGGAVLRRENWGAMQHGIVVFLSGSAPLLAARVVAEGSESRPLIAPLADTAKDEQEELRKTTDKLSAILAERQCHYEMSDVEVTLSGGSGDKGLGAPAMMVAYRILKGVQAKIEAAREDRESKKNFKIEMKNGTPPSNGLSLEK